MVYVVERYLPGLDQDQLLDMLGNLGRATEELRGRSTLVRYLGSTIVPGDDACFCQFEGASEAAVAQANERAGVPFDRIVAAVTVPAAHELAGRISPSEDASKLVDEGAQV